MLAGSGALRRILDLARGERRVSRDALTVLSTGIDPYRIDNRRLGPDLFNHISDRSADAIAALEGVVDELDEDWADLSVGPPPVPDADISEKHDRQAPLISTTWDWAEATEVLKRRKSYADSEGAA